jgi:hypothetical protein
MFRSLPPCRINRSMPLNYRRLRQLREQTAIADQVAARSLEVLEQKLGTGSAMLKSPVTRKLCQWWEEQRKAGPVLRRNFDPTLLGANMRDIYLVRKLAGSPCRFVMKIVGERIIDIAGFDNTGAAISPDEGPQADRALASYYAQIMQSDCPSLCRGTFNHADFPTVPFEAVDCPLWEPDGEAPASLVGCLMLLEQED